MACIAFRVMGDFGDELIMKEEQKKSNFLKSRLFCVSAYVG